MVAAANSDGFDASEKKLERSSDALGNTFKDVADENGDFYVKRADGSPDGERRSRFTGSDNLISAIQKAEKKKINNLYPMDTTIVKIGKCFFSPKTLKNDF